MSNLIAKTTTRLDVFDLLRGFYIFGIIVNHVNLIPNVFLYITGATKLWVSFAEGFFLVSGFFVGFLYKDKIRTDLWGTTKKVVKRSFQLYLWTILLTFIFVFWGNLLPAGTVKESLWIVSGENVTDLILGTFAFQYQYGWANILPYYSAYLLLTPLFLYLLTKGLFKYLVAGVLCVWLFRDRNTYMAIQPMFFGGLIAGFYADSIKYYWSRIGEKSRSLISNSTIYFFMMTLFFSVFFVFYFKDFAYFLPNSDYWLEKVKVLNWYFDKETMGLGRLVLAPIWHLGLFFIFQRYESFVVKFFGWLLFVLGRNSLNSYILHSFVIYPIPFLVGQYNIGGFFENSIVTAVSVVLVYVLTLLWLLFKSNKKE